MEDKQREHIHNNLDKLIYMTSYEELMKQCVDNGLLTLSMRHQIENITEDICTEELKNYERHRRLFVKLTKRGPTAYIHLKTILSEMKCDKAVLLLNEPMHQESQFTTLHPGLFESRDSPPSANIKNNNYNNFNTHKNTNSNNMPVAQMHELLGDKKEQRRLIDTNDGITENSPDKRDANGYPLLEPYGKEIQPMGYEVKKSNKIHIDEQTGWYPMKTKNRGVFFCVNIIDFLRQSSRRDGAEEDRKSLLYLFQELGYKIFYYENLRKCDFVYLLDLILHSDYAKETESFVMILMSHGESMERHQEHVEFTDGSFMKVDDIEKHFYNNVCEHLKHKPKILIFPFCRGEMYDVPKTILPINSTKTNEPKHQNQQFYDTETDHVSHDMPKATPLCSDILISFASLPGFVAHRDRFQGSWYIQTFCKIMAENAHNTSLLSILMMTQNVIQKYEDKGALQTPCYINIGFSKALYFNPGFSEE